MVAGTRCCKGAAHHLCVAQLADKQLLADVNGCKGGQCTPQRMPCGVPMLPQTILSSTAQPCTGVMQQGNISPEEHETIRAGRCNAMMQ